MDYANPVVRREEGRTPASRDERATLPAVMHGDVLCTAGVYETSMHSTKSCKVSSQSKERVLSQSKGENTGTMLVGGYWERASSQSKLRKHPGACM